jgi:hypothetical protein
MQTDQARATVVLKARPGEVLADLLPFLAPGSTVAIARAGAVITAIHDGNCGDRLLMLENQLAIAEAVISNTPKASEAISAVDPRDLFIEANPIGATADELEKGRSGFVDDRTHGDYLIFLAGYRAAQEPGL